LSFFRVKFVIFSRQFSLLRLKTPKVYVCYQKSYVIIHKGKLHLQISEITSKLRHNGCYNI